MFWNVYYVKGAFLSADTAFEVMQGMKSLSVRMLQKCINTLILARFLNSHPSINVHCNAVGNNDNSEFRERYMYLQLPAPLFTIDMGNIPRTAFQRFFDSLSPTFGHMISLGQSNTIVSCPSLTTHSELDEAALTAAGMSPTTIRFAVGDESPNRPDSPHRVHGSRHDRPGRRRFLRRIHERIGSEETHSSLLHTVSRSARGRAAKTAWRSVVLNGAKTATSSATMPRRYSFLWLISFRCILGRVGPNGPRMTSC